MPIFNGNLEIENGAFKTLGELIRAAVGNRTGISAAAVAAEQSRWRCAVIGEGFLRPADGDLYSIDAFKGVVSGVAVQADWNAADFTKSPGGGEPLAADISRHFDHGTSADSLVLYNGSGATVHIYIYAQANN
jgi:hypothetical protein